MELIIDKSKFSDGLNLDRFKEDLISANLKGQVISIKDNVTTLLITGDQDLNNTDDIKTINTVVADHDGTPNVDSALNNLTAITDPTITDDLNAGYSKFSFWINTLLNTVFINTNPAAGASIWKDITQQLAASGASYIDEPFHTGNLNQNTIGIYGWRSTGTGNGNAITVQQEAGHPGIIQLKTGVAAGGRRSVYMGQPSSLSWILSTSGISNTIEVEWLIKFGGSIIAADLEVAQLGLFSSADEAPAGVAVDGIGVILDPTASTTFRIMSADGGTRSFSDGTTVVALGTWYRVSMVYTDTGSGGSLQLKVNGNNEGSPITTNFPTVALHEMAKIDSQPGTISPTIDIDRMRIFYAPNMED